MNYMKEAQTAKKDVLKIAMNLSAYLREWFVKSCELQITLEAETLSHRRHKELRVRRFIEPHRIQRDSPANHFGILLKKGNICRLQGLLSFTIISSKFDFSRKGHSFRFRFLSEIEASFHVVRLHLLIRFSWILIQTNPWEDFEKIGFWIILFDNPFRKKESLLESFLYRNILESRSRRRIVCRLNWLVPVFLIYELLHFIQLQY